MAHKDGPRIGRLDPGKAKIMSECATDDEIEMHRREAEECGGCVACMDRMEAHQPD